MRELAKRLQELINQGVHEASLDEMVAQCRSAAVTGRCTCAALALGGLLTYVRGLVADSPLPYEQAVRIQELLSPLIEDLLRIPEDSQAGACSAFDAHQEEIGRLLSPQS